MPAPLSVVIPTLDAEVEAAPLMAQLVQGVAAGLVREVIVTDGGSTDGIAALADAAGAVFVNGPPGRGAQLRRGVAASRGDWLLVLHADSALPEGWVGIVEGAIADPTSAHVFHLRFRASGLAPKLVAGWANLRTGLFGLPYGDQGLLVSRKMYDAAGGYAAIPLMEDVALARALGGRISLMPAAVTTSAERYQSEGWLRRGAGNLWTLLRYLAGADPERLARSYASGSAVNRDSAR